MTWLTRWRDRVFERKVEGVRLVGASVAENTAPVLAVGGTVTLSPRMIDAGGAIAKYHTAPTFEYESADEAKATVDDNGVVTCVYTGSADSTVVMSVTATTDGGQEFTDSVTVTITGNTTPASVDTLPATVTLAAAGTQQLTSVVKNAGGSTIAGLSPTSYTTSDATKATVSASGLITAVATGSATITVHYNALTDTCVVTVS